jgi:ubiquinone/menaquinone biosynthesis C-methylase UbiE
MVREHDVHEAWEGRAPTGAADAKNPKVYYTWRNDFVRELIIRHTKGGSVLDVGCGTGILLRQLAERGFDPHGADISETMIRYTRERLADLVDDLDSRFRVSTGGEMPFAGQTFDLVSCIDAIIYVPEYAPFIRELAARIKPGGYLAISCTQRFVPFAYVSILRMLPHAYHPRSFLKTCRNLIRTGLWSGGHVDYRTAKQVYSAERFDRLIAQIGLTKVDEFDLVHFHCFDKNPLERKGLGKRLARRFAWNHIGLYQKPLLSATTAASSDNRGGAGQG